MTGQSSLCLQANDGEREWLLTAGETLVAQDEEGRRFRAQTGFVGILPKDSVAVATPDESRCALAASRYRAARLLRFPADSSFPLRPIFLVRLGGRGYVGDARVGDRRTREFVVFDSTLAVLTIVRGVR